MYLVTITLIFLSLIYNCLFIFSRGNQGIGPTSDGTAIYINGLLAPELTLQRGLFAFT